jgi:hypothetical protein
MRKTPLATATPLPHIARQPSLSLSLSASAVQSLLLISSPSGSARERAMHQRFRPSLGAVLKGTGHSRD